MSRAAAFVDLALVLLALCLVPSSPCLYLSPLSPVGRGRGLLSLLVCCHGRLWSRGHGRYGLALGGLAVAVAGPFLFRGPLRIVLCLSLLCSPLRDQLCFLSLAHCGFFCRQSEACLVAKEKQWQMQWSTRTPPLPMR